MTTLIVASNVPVNVARWFSDLPEALGAWLLTYLLHSTVIILIALALNSALRSAAESLRELILRFALVGGIASATISFAMPSTNLSASQWWASLAGSPPSIESVPPELGEIRGMVSAGSSAGEPDGTTSRGDVAPDAASLSDSLRNGFSSPSGIPLLLMIVAFAAGFVIAIHSVAWSHVRLRRAIRHRATIPPGSRARQLLDELIARTSLGHSRLGRRIRLSSAEGLAVPIAMGIIRQEICIPRERVDSLDDSRLRLVLAHELCHLIRRDPAWQLMCRTIEAVFFFQPLNVAVRRALRSIAEFQCDTWACQTSAERTQLARVLTDIAQWMLAGDANTRLNLLAPAAAMAERPSGIRRRVERLLGEPTAAPSSRRGRASAAAACLLSIGGIAVAAPRIAPPVERARVAEGSDDAISPILADLDGEVALLRGEAALLARRARDLDADQATLELLSEIESRLDLVDRLRRDARNAATSQPDSITISSDEPVNKGRRPHQ